MVGIAAEGTSSRQDAVDNSRTAATAATAVCKQGTAALALLRTSIARGMDNSQ